MNQSEAPASEPYIDYDEAAEYLSMPLGTLRNKVSAGEIPHYKRGRIVRFRRSELDAYMRGEDPKTTGGG